ncbi:MAG: hypothetical protein KKB20_23540 [Proteobacteria bacterium]|nr:hypothetical protein [Pseudomonadota bacterium]
MPPIGRDEYLSLLDWTGREILAGKRGAIPAHPADILDRISINQVVGRIEAMMDRARLWGKRRPGGRTFNQVL